MIATLAVVGSGVLAGVYTAFSTMVIPALRRGTARDAAAAMTAINRRAERGPFLLLFGGTAVAAAALGVSGLVGGSTLDVVVAGASLSGTAITVLWSVPLNRSLDRGGADEWDRYARSWTRWNTVRALLSAIAAVVAAVHRE